MRTIVVVLALGTASASAQTPAATDALAPLYACADTADSAARLACYDSEVGRRRSASSAGHLVAVDRGQVATLERDAFGFNLPSLSRLIPRLNDNRPEIDRVEMSIERVSRGGDGKLLFVMADGQRWRQIDTEPGRNIDAGDIVEIRRASLGSYMLVPRGGGAPIRVQRQS